MVLTVTQITVDLGHVRYPFFNFQFAGNTIRAERNRKIRIIFYRLTIAVNRSLNTGGVGDFQRIMKTLNIGIKLIFETHPIHRQLFLLIAGFDFQLVTNIFQRLFHDDIRDVLNIASQHFLRFFPRRRGKTQRPRRK